MSIFRAFKNTQVHALTVFELTCHFISVSLTLPTCLCLAFAQQEMSLGFFFFFFKSLFLRPSHCSVGYRSCSRGRKMDSCWLIRIPCRKLLSPPHPESSFKGGSYDHWYFGDKGKGQLNENCAQLTELERKCKVLGEKLQSVCRSLDFGVFYLLVYFVSSLCI